MEIHESAQSVDLPQDLRSRRKAREAVTLCQLAEILSNREFQHHFVINFLSFANT